LRGNGYASLVGVDLADDSNGEVCVWDRSDRRDVFGRSCSVTFMPGREDPRDAGTELLSLLIPLLRRTIERSNMASWKRDC
jgi:hypothetical protein